MITEQDAWRMIKNFREEIDSNDYLDSLIDVLNNIMARQKGE